MGLTFAESKDILREVLPNDLSNERVLRQARCTKYSPVVGLNTVMERASEKDYTDEISLIPGKNVIEVRDQLDYDGYDELSEFIKSEHTTPQTTITEETNQSITIQFEESALDSDLLDHIEEHYRIIEVSFGPLEITVDGGLNDPRLPLEFAGTENTCPNCGFNGVLGKVCPECHIRYYSMSDEVNSIQDITESVETLVDYSEFRKITDSIYTGEGTGIVYHPLWILKDEPKRWLAINIDDDGILPVYSVDDNQCVYSGTYSTLAEQASHECEFCGSDADRDMQGFTHATVGDDDLQARVFDICSECYEKTISQCEECIEDHSSEITASFI